MKKNSLHILFKNLTFKLLIVLLALTSACKHKDDVIPEIGSLSIYNISPTFNTYDVSINSVKVNTAALPFGGGTKYSQLPVGIYAAQFNTAGSADNVYTKSGVSIGVSAFHTLYLLGTAGNFDGLSVQDNFANTSITKAYVRFINLSPDAPALSLTIKDVVAPITTSKTYKSYSDFVELEPGVKVFEIKETSSGTVTSTLESSNFVAGKFYTIISRGKVNPASSLERPFSGQIILHQ